MLIGSRTPDFKKLKKKFKETSHFEGRNLYDLEEMEREGFYSNSIERKL